MGFAQRTPPVYGTVRSLGNPIDLPNPGDNLIVGPFNMEQWRSTVIQVSDPGDELDVTLVWEDPDNPGVAQTTASMTLDAGSDHWELITNQGKTLVSVTFTAPNGNVNFEEEVLGSNLDPFDLCGIRFNRPNGRVDLGEKCHGWLYVATDRNGGPDNVGIALVAVPGEIEIFADQRVQIASSSNDIFLNAVGIHLLSTALGGGIDLTSGSTASFNVRVGDLQLDLFPTGDKVVFRDRTNAPILEVRQDGSIHGRAAVGAITWDL